MQEYLQLDLRELTTAREVATRLDAACRSSHIVHVRLQPALGTVRDFWDDVLDRCGERVPVDEDSKTGRPTGALWSEVEFDPQRTHTFRHSNSAQPLHTDGSYVADPPPIIFLICSRAASRGGATVFLDGRYLMERLSTEAPELLASLIATPLAFGKGGSDVESPAIMPRADSPLLRWNYYALRRDLPETSRRVAERFRFFLQGLVERGAVRSLRLDAGDAVFFSDSAVLHGREAFDAVTAGERCLWKGGVHLRTGHC